MSTNEKKLNTEILEALLEAIERNTESILQIDSSLSNIFQYNAYHSSITPPTAEIGEVRYLLAELSRINAVNRDHVGLLSKEEPVGLDENGHYRRGQVPQDYTGRDQLDPFGYFDDPFGRTIERRERR